MKDFLLICDKNCATYKEVFPLFKQGIVSFGSPVKEYDGTDRKFGNHSWITTFPVPNKKKLVLTATYDPALYPKYDNYDAIEVSRVKNIPYNYDGVMGVPITIFDYDLDNVEIDGLLGNFKEEDCNEATGFVCGDDVSAYNLPGTHNGPVIITTKGPEAKYKRVLIKKNFEVLKCLNDNTPDTRTALLKGKEKYSRVLIKKNFEIVGMAAGNSAVNGFGDEGGYNRHKEDRGGCGVINNKRIYTRILIWRKGE